MSAQMPDFIERLECPECGEERLSVHQKGCSHGFKVVTGDEVVTVRRDLAALMKRPAPPDAEVLTAVRLVSRRIWHQTYRMGEGPFHHAGGPAHRRKLLADADSLERLVRAMRVVADYLPDGEDFFDVPARRETPSAAQGRSFDEVRRTVG